MDDDNVVPIGGKEPPKASTEQIDLETAARAERAAEAVLNTFSVQNLGWGHFYVTGMGSVAPMGFRMTAEATLGEVWVRLAEGETPEDPDEEAT